MRDLWAHLRRAILRVVPAALTQAQAIAFVMFLSFFPVLLLSLGLLSLSGWSADPARELPASFQLVLPAGSIRLISEFLERMPGSPWKLISLGLFGTFLFVTQAMANYVDGFAIVWQDPEKPSYWRRYRRAIRMLCLTIVPWLLTGILTVFGRELRTFLALFFGGGLMMRIVWAVVYDGAALATAFLALIVMYHVARPHRRWRDQVPGALIATILWWLLTAGFSLYVRNMHYNLIYGSMAAVIGLMVWMYFVALVVMVGAAYNAVAATAGSDGKSSGNGAGGQGTGARRAVAAAQR
jgi:membrane protein